MEGLTHLIAFLLGCALVYWLKRAELKNLYQVNKELRHSLYQRIGFKPEQPVKRKRFSWMTKDGEIKAEEKEPDEKDVTDRMSVPDVKKMQQALIDASDKRYGGMPLETWLTMSDKQQQEILDAKPK